jgi:magnesium-transporting ATPase (P-type)
VVFDALPPFRTILFPLILLNLDLMDATRPRSAGVTAAATYVILCCITAFLVWGYIFLGALNAPPDEQGRHLYEVDPVTFFLIALVPPAMIAAGIRTCIGVLQLRPWARRTSMVCAATVLVVCLLLIAFRPFETFVIPRGFVKQSVLTRQMLAISFVFMLLPVSVWWLFYFRTRKVRQQFLPPDSAEVTAEKSQT